MTVLSALNNSNHFCFLLAGLLAFWYFQHVVRAWYRLRHIPGPPSLGWSNWWLIRAHANGKTHLELDEICERYGLILLPLALNNMLTSQGKLVRIGPNDLITSDPEVLRRILGVRSPYSRAPYYEGFRFDPYRDNVLSQTDNFQHGVLRAKMAAGVS